MTLSSSTGGGVGRSSGHHHRHCVVVGGGPIGLATALTLSNPPHSYNVTVLEQRSLDQRVEQYDPTRAYLYNLNVRGLEWLEEFPYAAQRVNNDYGVDQTQLGPQSRVDIPANPDEPIENLNSMLVNVVTKGGKNNNNTTVSTASSSSTATGRSDQGDNNNDDDDNNKNNADRTKLFHSRSSIWIPRHQMVQLLLEACYQQQQQQRGMKTQGTRKQDDDDHHHHAQNTDDEDVDEEEEALLSNSVSPTMNRGRRTSIGTAVVGSIQVCNGKQVIQLSQEHDDDDCIHIHCQDGSTYEATLLVGADGIDSSVRTLLANNGGDLTSSSSSSSSWLYSQPQAFQVKKFRSPSTGLKLKVLQFPPNFTIVSSDINNINGTTTRSVVPSQSSFIYIFRSVNTGTERMSLGLLPMKDSTLMRPANVNTRYNHKLWSITDGPTMKQYFTKSFPRIVWDELVPDNNEWDRFAKAKGTVFPMPQYSPGSVLSSPYHPNHVGIVLVGDACHAFPPDIGQGINSGLNDVLALDRCLQGHDIVTGKPLCTGTTRSSHDDDDDNDVLVVGKQDKQQQQRPPSLSVALKRYQDNRRPEHAALIRLARFGAPYQYKQSWLRDRVIGYPLWLANLVLRQILNKVTGGWIPPAAFLLCYSSAKTRTKNKKKNQLQEEEEYLLTFRQIMQRADRTTLALQIVAAGLLWLLCGRWISQHLLGSIMMAMPTT